MRVSAISNSQMRKQSLKAAGQGALMTGGLIAAGQAYTWVRHKDAMTKLVENYGGKSAYFKQYALGTVAVMAVSALISAAMPYIANKVAPVEPPRAAN